MLHGVGEQLFQDEVEVEFNLATQLVRLAELPDFRGQPRKLVEVAVENEFRFGQNGLIVAHPVGAFNI